MPDRRRPERPPGLSIPAGMAWSCFSPNAGSRRAGERQNSSLSTAKLEERKTVSEPRLRPAACLRFPTAAKKKRPAETAERPLESESSDYGEVFGAAVGF